LVLLGECLPIAVLTVAPQKKSPTSGRGLEDMFGSDLPSYDEAPRSQSDYTT